jgi:hypothetical protein
MSKHNPYFSPLSCGIAFVLVLGLIAVLVMMGRRVFSPGPLTAVHPQNQPLQGFASHADFENECSRCHAPLQGATTDRCLACHVTVDTELKANTGVHGALPGVDDCSSCHLEHLGREARITRFDTTDFPHQQASGFSLSKHITNYNGLPFACADCHASAGYKFEQTGCAMCHAQAESVFIVEHQANAGEECLLCHDGSGRMAQFDHALFFLLEGAHATVACVDCHANNRLENTPADCYSCHAADDAHSGFLDSDCNACHSTATWQQATLQNHTFPFTHGNDGRPLECETCHIDTTFSTYTCYGCHEHNPFEIERKHLEEGMRNFQDCAACHPTGREHEGNNDDD